MPVIRIKPQTFKRLQAWALPLEDNPDDTIQKVLDAAWAHRQCLSAQAQEDTNNPDQESTGWRGDRCPVCQEHVAPTREHYPPHTPGQQPEQTPCYGSNLSTDPELGTHQLKLMLYYYQNTPERSEDARKLQKALDRIKGQQP